MISTRFTISAIAIVGASSAFAAPQYTIDAWVSRDVAPGKNVRLTLNTRNVPVVRVEAYSVDGRSWLRKERRETERPLPVGNARASWTITVSNPGQDPRAVDTYNSRQVNLPIGTPGVYLLRISGRGRQTSVVVNVTDLAVVVKRSATQALVWVTDHKSRKVVPRASIEYFDKDGNTIASGSTRLDGTSLTGLPLQATRLIVRRGLDMAGLEVRGSSGDGQLRALFQTDRPIYRPGQTVSFKAILRRTAGQGYRPVTDRDISVRLRDPRDNPLDEVRLRPTGLGTVFGSFRIPLEGMLGAYTLSLLDGQDTAYQTITVASYRKPEFKLETAPTAKRYLAGDEVRYRVNAAYYFGAPVPQAQIRWVARRTPLALGDSDEVQSEFYGGDGNLYARDTYASQPFVGEGTTFTDEQGEATIAVKSDPNWPDSTYSLQITVADSSRRQVEGSSSVPVYAATRRVGLSSPKQSVALGDLIPVQIRVSDLDGLPQGGVVDLELIQQVWVEKQGRYERKRLTSMTARVTNGGRTQINLPALAQGPLTVEARLKDPTGRIAKASMDAYVFGPDYVPERQRANPTLDLRLDRRMYEPGQTARAYVRSNSREPILLVLEGREIWDYKVLQRSGTWKIPTSDRLSPNGYVTADQWIHSNQLSANSILPVPDLTRRLKVDITPDSPTYKPGEQAGFTVRTSDRTGRPVPAEVSLAVVDEAIYALSPDTTPDPYGFYWGLRPNQVEEYRSAPEELSGGAYQRSNSVAPVRQRFEDTAFWGPVVRTGTDGTARVHFEMPGNLTRWRATGRAVTSETRVGTGVSTVLATRPLTLRLATPRVVVQGDRFTLIGTVDNRTAAPTTATVSLSADCFRVQGEATRSLDLPAKGQGKVEWALEASEVPPSSLAILAATVQADGTDMADALRVTVPVVPRGMAKIAVAGGTIQRSTPIALPVASDALPAGTSLHVVLSGGFAATSESMAGEVLRSGRYGTLSASNMLEAISVLGAPSHLDDSKEALALLSRTQGGEGWGWWDGCPADPAITSKALFALALARKAGVRVYDNLANPAVSGSTSLYNRTTLWEHRALLAAGIAMLNPDLGLPHIQEVRERGQNLSPFALLRMAEALARAGKRDIAHDLLEPIRKTVSDGPSAAFVPVGDGIGWTASSVDTTAQLLEVLVRLDDSTELQSRLAHWLALPDEPTWLPDDSRAIVSRALHDYMSRHPAAVRVGSASIVVGGTRHPLTPSTVAPSSAIDLVGVPLSDLALERDGEGEAFWQVSARYYVPTLDESRHGIRVVRRFEVRNQAGVWTEVDRAIHPGEPVRCTVSVWGDDLDDAVKVTEPIPTGFEFVDSEVPMNAREEVRDGALVHYMVNAGAPATFRYYLRAEADGKLIALPAVAQYLRRPAKEGHSASDEVEVAK